MTVRFGLVGAGPWASLFHAPMLAAGTRSEFVAVWARDHARASALANQYGARAADSIDDLLETVDAVAFAVPPGVQVELAQRAARAGKHLLLEKPLAFTVADAEDLARSSDEAGIMTQLMLTNRFRPGVIRAIDDIRALRPLAGLATVVVGGSAPGKMFATPWRIERGALLDVGPHVFDLLEYATGPVVAVSAAGDPCHFVAVSLLHSGGQVSQAFLSINAPGVALPSQYTFWSAEGAHTVTGGSQPDESLTRRAILDALVTAIEADAPPLLDVHRGLYLQRVIGAAEESLSSRGQLVAVASEA